MSIQLIKILIFNIIPQFNKFGTNSINFKVIIFNINKIFLISFLSNLPCNSGDTKHILKLFLINNKFSYLTDIC